MEQLNLTAPLATSAVVVERLVLDWKGASIRVELRSPGNGPMRQYDYYGDEATTLMQALNKANLSVKSLHKRILERLIADHPELAGTITGAVD